MGNRMPGKMSVTKSIAPKPTGIGRWLQGPHAGGTQQRWS